MSSLCIVAGRRSTFFVPKQVIAFAAMAVLASSTFADTFTWVGLSTATSPFNADTLAPKLTGLNVPTTTSLWTAGVPKRNWQLANGNAPLDVPGQNDVAVFASGLTSGNPLSTTDRTINSLQLLGSSQNYVLQFMDSMFTIKKTLTVQSGQIATGTGTGTVWIQGNVVSPTAANFDVSLKQVGIWGALAVGGSLTKTGTGSLEFGEGHSGIDSLVGGINVQSGFVGAYRTICTGAINIGVGNGPGATLLWRRKGDTQARIVPSITVANEGLLQYDDVIRATTVNLTGNITMERQGASRLELQTLNATPNGNSPALFDNAVFVNNPTTEASLDFRPFASGLIQLNGATDSAQVLKLQNVRLMANALTVQGRGVMTLSDFQTPGLSDANYRSSIGSLSVRSGTVVADRDDEINALGNDITIGASGVTIPAAVKSLRRNQLADDASITLYPNGLLYMGDDERIGSIQFVGGGAIQSPVDRFITLNASTVTMTGSNGTATWNSHRILAPLNSSDPFVVDVAATNTLTITSDISGSTDFVKRGTGTLTLAGSLFTNMTTVETGTLNNAGFTTGSGITLGTPGQTLNLPNVVSGGIFTSGSITSNAGILTLPTGTSFTDLTMRGGRIDIGSGWDLQARGTVATIDTSGRTATINGNFEIPSAYELAINSTAGMSRLDLNGNIIAANPTHVLTKSGSGSLLLGGASDNQQSSTIVTGGTIILTKLPGRSALGDAVTVGNGGQTSGGPSLLWFNNDQLLDTVVVALRSGTLDLNGRSDAIAGINVSLGGTMNVVTGAGTLTLLGNSIAFAGTNLPFQGNLDLGGGTRGFSARGSSTFAPSFVNFNIGGTINNGTFSKGGVGIVRFGTVTGNAVLNVADGTASIGTATFGGLTGTAAVQVDTSLTLSTAILSSYAFSGSLAGAGRLVKSGPGTQALNSASNLLVGGIDVSQGELAAGHVGALGTGPLRVRGFTRLALTAPGGATFLLEHSRLTLDSFFTIKLGDDAMAVHYVGASPYASYLAAIKQAYNAGAWNNFGIGSDLASASPTRYGVGIAEASAALGALPATWRGQTISANTVLIAPALLGDSNLNGTVTFDDLLRLVQNYNGSGKIWTDGDFNYDGVVNFDDVLALSQNYVQAVSVAELMLLDHAAGRDFASDWAMARSLTPEPCSTLALAGAALVLRRRR